MTEGEELFTIATMPPSRPANYYLSYLDGCVFMDFNKTAAEGIQLIRISFDSYGCCEVKNAVPMDPADAQHFKTMMKKRVLDQELLMGIIKKTIKDNKVLLWEDVLAKYKLL